MRLANSDAPIGAAGSQTARPMVPYTEADAPTPITNPITTPEVRALETTPDMFQPVGDETRPARRLVAFFSRVSEGHHLRGGDHANGLHAVIARQANGVPRGQQTPWPTASPSTLFRPPEPWDRGTTRATPASGG